MQYSITAKSMASYQTSWYHSGEAIQGYYNNGTSNVYFGYFWFSDNDLANLRSVLNSGIQVEKVELYFERTNSSHGTTSSTPVQINTTTRRSASGVPSISELGEGLIIGSFKRGEGKYCTLNETLLNHLLNGGNGFCLYHSSVKASGEFSYYVRSNIYPTLRVTYSTKYSEPTFNTSECDFGSTLKTTITAHDSTFHHTLFYRFGTESLQYEIPAGTLEHDFTVPLSWMNQIPNEVSAIMNVQLNTYDSDGNGIGAIGTIVKLTVPANIKPTAGSIAFTLTNGAWNCALVNRTSIMAKLNGYSGAYGSSIKAITMSGGSFMSTTNELDIATLTETGTLTVSATVTDSRGRNATVSKQIQVFEYALPYFESLEVGRCNQLGTLSSDGHYVRVLATFACSSVNNNNSVTCNVSYVAKSTNEVVSAGIITSGATKLIGGGALASDEEYTLIFTLTDGLESATYYRFINSSAFAMHFKNGGRGAALGQAATEDETFRVHKDWHVYFGNNGVDFANLIPEDIDAADRDHSHNLSDDSITGLIPPERVAQSYQDALGIVNVLKSALLNTIYPVGSVYISTSDTDPATFIGGTWARIQDTFLLAAGTKHSAGSSGGAESYALKASHTHTAPIGYSGNIMGFVNINGTASTGKGKLYRSGTAQNTGSSLGANINMGKTSSESISETIPTMPPYTTVYVWQRTA